MPDGGRELSHERKVAGLARRPFCQAGQRPAEWLVVSEDREHPALRNVAKVLDRQKDSEEFAVESAVLLLGVTQLLREERERTVVGLREDCLLYTSPSPRDLSTSRMPSSA